MLTASEGFEADVYNTINESCVTDCKPLICQLAVIALLQLADACHDEGH
jgi:hypothetical protein